MNIREITGYLKKNKEIIACYLFGSAAKGKATPKSDIDLALILKGRKKSELDYHLGIARLLRNKTADVKVLNGAPLFFQHKVFREGKLIYCSDTRSRVEYEVRIMNEYFDFKPFLDYYNKCMYRHIAEGSYGN
jgi:predicted nucleotidyltransferase